MTRPSAHTLVLAFTFTAGIAVGCGVRPASAPAAEPRVADTRVFELRTYTAPPGKLPALHRRFREHTMALFARHGMTNVGYWTPQDSARRENTIVYLLAYPSREAARASWSAFGRDPEWRKVQAESEANGPIVERVESVFLDPTDFSPMQ
jgi:NIPSNAP